MNVRIVSILIVTALIASGCSIHGPKIKIKGPGKAKIKVGQSLSEVRVVAAEKSMGSESVAGLAISHNLAGVNPAL